jgi:hypothetical protein
VAPNRIEADPADPRYIRELVSARRSVSEPNTAADRRSNDLELNFFIQTIQIARAMWARIFICKYLFDSAMQCWYQQDSQNAHVQMQCRG